VFVFITHEAAGASTPGIPHALVFKGGTFLQTSGISCRENAELWPVIGCLKIESVASHDTAIPGSLASLAPE